MISSKGTFVNKLHQNILIGIRNSNKALDKGKGVIHGVLVYSKFL